MIAVPLPQFSGSMAPPAMAADSRMLLAVGRLVPQKGYPLLLEAFAELVIDFPQWHLYILGAGSPEDISYNIRQLSLDTQVTVVGAVGNVEQWYRHADVYVMTSLFEGFPNSLLEAMACGCAVVSFDCTTGPGDIIKHGENGLLVAPQNVPELVRVLRELLSDESLRRKLSEKSTDVLERYSTQKVLSAWEDALDIKVQDKVAR
jgi:glycosyltransferase involved in cell wall biosynthesis